MICAILEGRKTMTRRPVKPQPFMQSLDGIPIQEINKKLHALTNGSCKRCPFGQVGDRLWVRETWAIEHLNYDSHCKCSIKYFANNKIEDFKAFPIKDRYKYLGKYQKRPSIHMPRWASRITLEITNIRVERLQEISEEDAKREGCDAIRGEGCSFYLARQGFELLWGVLYSPKGFHWRDNPWVWVIEYKRI